MTPEIMLSNGGYYNFIDCDVADVTPEVIANSLANMCRFSGHVSRFYSVAEHCVRCSYLGPDDEAMERLMHDAAECLVVDLPSPLKRMEGMDAYRDHDHAAEAALAAKFGLVYPWPPSVRSADLTMLATERRDLLPAGKNQSAWQIIKDIPPLADVSLVGRDGSPENWRKRWLDRFHQLSAQRDQ